MGLLSALIGVLLDRLDERQLRVVHERIVNLLRSLHRTRECTRLAQFQVRDRVSFVYRGGRHTGTVCRVNRRTATVRADDGKEWNVSPTFLTKIGMLEPLAATSV